MSGGLSEFSSLLTVLLPEHFADEAWLEVLANEERDALVQRPWVQNARSL